MYVAIRSIYSVNQCVSASHASPRQSRTNAIPMGFCSVMMLLQCMCQSSNQLHGIPLPALCRQHDASACALSGGRCVRHRRRPDRHVPGPHCSVLGPLMGLGDATQERAVPPCRPATEHSPCADGGCSVSRYGWADFAACGGSRGTCRVDGMGNWSFG